MSIAQTSRRRRQARCEHIGVALEAYLTELLARSASSAELTLDAYVANVELLWDGPAADLQRFRALARAAGAHEFGLVA